MNRRSILTKTGKGLMEATGKSSNLSRDLRNILKEIDGKVSVSGLLKKFEKIPERELGEALRNLVRDGYVREFIGQQDGGPRVATGRPPAPQASEGAGGDLDFTDFTPLKPSSEDERLQAQAREIARQAQATRTREEAAAKTKAKTQASTQAEALDRVRREEEERSRSESDLKRLAEGEARKRRDAEEGEALMRSLREQEEKVQEAEQREREEKERREREEGERKEGEEARRKEEEKRGEE